MAEQPYQLGDAMGPAGQPSSGRRQLLHKSLSPASTIAAAPAAKPELQDHTRTLNRQILQSPIMPAVPRSRLLGAIGAAPIPSTNGRNQPSTADQRGIDEVNLWPQSPTHVLFHAGEIVCEPTVNQPGCTGSESDPLNLRIPCRINISLSRGFVQRDSGSRSRRCPIGAARPHSYGAAHAA